MVTPKKGRRMKLSMYNDNAICQNMGNTNNVFSYRRAFISEVVIMVYRIFWRTQVIVGRVFLVQTCCCWPPSDIVKDMRLPTLCTHFNVITLTAQWFSHDESHPNQSAPMLVNTSTYSYFF